MLGFSLMPKRRIDDEQNSAEAALRNLSARLLQVQDEERRRIAREMHDSVGQLVAAISMNLSAVEKQSDKRDARGVKAVAETIVLVEEIDREIRTISHLLHPPLLDEAGLGSALRWYVDGFSERSKISVDLSIPSDFGRLPHDMEIAIFRIVQECLTNIHRHSGSATAIINMVAEDSRIVVRVQDRGKGIPLKRQSELNSTDRTGVGFRGMRERIRQLDGSFEIQSDANGTVIVANLPLRHS
jgi:two-component system, NarL family, sensor kinase